MKRLLAPLLILGLAAATPVAALAQDARGQSAQEAAREATQSGNVLPLRRIESIVFGSLGGPVCNGGQSSARDNCFEYLGPAYDPTAMAYRLKFMRASRVTFVDIDARTGRILRRSR